MTNDLYLRIPPVEGVQRAKADISSVGDAAEQAGRKVQQIGTRVGATFGDSGANALTAGVGSSISVASGVGAATSALRDFNTAGLAISGATLLRDVADMGRSFREAGGAISGATGPLSGFFAIIKANPLLVISTGIAAIGAAFLALGNSAKEAEAQVDPLIQKLRDVSSLQFSQRSLSLPNADAVAARSRQQSLIDLQARLFDSNDKEFGVGGSAVRTRTLPTGQREEYIGARRVRELLGLESYQLDELRLRATTQRDNPRLFSLLQLGQASSRQISRREFQRLIQAQFLTQSGIERGADPSLYNFGAAPSFPINFGFPEGYGDGSLLLRGSGGGSAPATARFAAGGLAFEGLGSGPLTPFANFGSEFDSLYGSNYGDGSLLRVTPRQQMQQNYEAQVQRLREAEQVMRELVSLGNQLGASLGDAFFNALTGAQSLRDALGQVVAQFARQGLQQGIAGLTGSLFGSFAPSAGQASVGNVPPTTANPGIPGGGS